jgi:hypothetical protein
LKDPSPGLRVADGLSKTTRGTPQALAGLHVVAFVGYLLKHAALLMQSA